LESLQKGDDIVNKPLRNMMAIVVLLAMGALLPAQRAAAAAPKPALTIAFAGYSQLIDSIKALDDLSGHTKLAAKAEGSIELQTHGKGLAGLDKSRPWGVLVSLGENDQPIVQGYLPVSDLKKLLAAMPTPGGEATPNADGVYEFPVADKTIYVKEKGKWAVFADSEEALKSAPADPAPALADLTKKYLLAIRGSVQNVPEASRDNALKALRGIVEFGLAMQQGGSEEQRAMMAANVKQLFQKLEKLSKELDTLTIGVGLDKSSKSLFLDVEALGVEGSDLAKKFEAMKDAKTDFAGFAMDGAAMSLLSAGTADDDDVATAKAALAGYKKNLDKLLDSNDQLGDKRELAKQLLGDILDVVEKTVELKKSDAGMAIVLEDGPAAIVGARIAEGAKLEGAIKKLVKELAKDEPKVEEIVKLDAEKYEGVNFHVATVPVPDANAAKVFGESVQIVVGISPSSLYFGAGKDPIAKIKKAIDASKASPGKAINPADMVISATSIAKFFAKVIPGNNPSDTQAKKNFAKAAALLAKSDGKDHVTMTVKAIPNGAAMRLNVESGVTKAILDLLPGAADSSDEN
jgi:hypothetical protein